MPLKKTKYIFVSGGVISGLGKGIFASSLGLLLKARGFSVTLMKCDMYLNIDAGTMNPLEHGETFITHDGLETDQDLGHYERFLNQTLSRQNYVTAGQVYTEVLKKERELGYEGRCVDAYIHVPGQIVEHWEKLAEKNDLVLVEMGGTVGEYQNILFFEAARRMKIKYRENVLFIHVGYLPVPPSIGEMKSKPLQQSIQKLNELGIQPDFIVCRSEKLIDERRKEKVSLSAALENKDIIADPDLPSVYELPLFLEKQKLAAKVLKKLHLKAKKAPDLHAWRQMVANSQKTKPVVRVGMVGKYYTSGGFSLEDSYVSVVEAIKHAAFSLKVKPEIVWFDSSVLEKENDFQPLLNLDALIVPQGWGSRGVEGKIKAVQLAREQKIPYLGLCFGMQMAVIEYARHVLGLKDANSTEVDPQTHAPVIHIMPDQRQYLTQKQYGGTIRLGAWPCRILKGTHLSKVYGQTGVVEERHRHRYEFNLDYREKLEKAGLKIAGISPDGKLVEAIELPDHPYFLATQFHPEYLSRPLSPHPLFVGLIRAALKRATAKA